MSSNYALTHMLNNLNERSPHQTQKVHKLSPKKAPAKTGALKDKEEK